MDLVQDTALATALGNGSVPFHQDDRYAAAPRVPVGHGRTTPATNARTLDGLERLAVEASAAGEVERSLELVRTAAEWAWFHHAGRFTSPLLEGVVGRAADDLSVRGVRRRGTGERRRHVLHVFTEAYDLGGHTRLARRWMEADRTSRHSVVVTTAVTVPEHVRSAVQRTAGVLHDLPGSSVLRRAELLLRLACEHDVVVLHVHPHDVVATVAVAGLVSRLPASARPPVVLMNHADHVFWLGTRCADVVANIRPSAIAVCTARRGLPADRCASLPIPLAAPDRHASRTQAKRALGLPGDAKVLLTIASAYKYLAHEDVHLADLVNPVLLRDPKAVLLAVGPQPGSHPWERASAITGGRVRALGYQQDLRPLHEAADVYLDSYPFPSLTSLLESCLHGMPALTFSPHGPGAGPMSIAGDVAPGHLLVAGSAQEYADMLHRLLGDQDHARRVGQATAATLLDEHTGEGWRRRMEHVYAAATRVRDSRGPHDVFPTPRDVLAPLDDFLVALHAQGAGADDATTFLSTRGGPALTCAVTGRTGGASYSLSVVLAVAGDVEATLGALHTVIERCLPALEDDVQTVVVDNASADGTDELLQALSGDVVVLSLPEPVAPEEAWAAGLAAATGDLVLLLSNDIRSTEDFVTPLIRRLAAAAPGTAVSAVERGSGCAVTPSRPRELSSTCLLGTGVDLLGQVPGRTVVDGTVPVVVERHAPPGTVDRSLSTAALAGDVLPEDGSASDPGAT